MILKFGTRVFLEELQIQRITREKKDEFVSANFSHHAHPMRGLYDSILCTHFVESETRLTEIQEEALKRALKDAFRHFNSRFVEHLETCKQEKELKP